MRVLWVTAMWPDERRPWYGPYIYSQAQSLRSAGVDLEVVYMPGYLRRTEYLRGVASLQSALRKRHFDVVHAHYGHCGIVGRMQRKAPLVISYCGDDLLGTPDERGAYSRASLLLAKTFAQLAYVADATITKSDGMAQRLPRSRRRKNHVLPNGVDLGAFTPMDQAAAKAKLGWDGTAPNVLFVGNPDSLRKNAKLAYEVCDEMARRGRPVELRVCWDLAQADVPVFMSAADALLFTSVSEGSPNAIKEAMAMELPIVSAPVGDVPERLDRVPGTYVVDYDRDAMASALESALDFGRTPAARVAVSELSLERVAARLIDLYGQLSS